jgi:predicted ABC-class ATPase
MEQRAEHLRAFLSDLDGTGYREYKRLGDRYVFQRFMLVIDHVQGDPFAEPSRMRALVPPDRAGLPAELLHSSARRTAVADFLNRVLFRELARSSSDRGSGQSGMLTVLEPGQQVLRRSSMLVHEDGSVEARFRAGLPARGRTILGHEAARLLCEEVPAAVGASLLHESLEAGALLAHVQAYEDSLSLREQLVGRGLVAFVGDGAILPRRSGIDDRPLEGTAAVPFSAPESLRVSLRTPHSGEITGMGIPEGITLLVGGGYHGKSTLLRALERGVYDHVPGDGRERVVTRADAVKVRAEDGRRVAGTDISNFIGPLPGGSDTRHFRTENASGSTSQAAAIVEALEVGSGCLLIDEDTSATNFLIRDARMQALIASRDEPIMPFVDRAGTLHRELGISVVLVVGGSGDYFDVADTVVAMRDYLPREVTGEARETVRRYPAARRSEAGPWAAIGERVPLPESIDARRGRRPVEIKAYDAERLRFGAGELDLTAVEQVVETAQARAIGRAIAWSKGGAIDGRTAMGPAMHAVVDALASGGLDLLDERIVGDYAEFRVYELAAALGRLRTLEVSPAPRRVARPTLPDGGG